MKFLNNIDLQKNELQNVRLQNLASAPSNPVEGQFYWNTQSKKMFMNNGTEWVDVGSSYVLPKATTTSLGGIIVGSNLTVDSSTGNLSVNEASTTQKGVIEIATDTEATTGTATNLAINPKQLANAISGLIKLTDISATSPIAYNNETGVISVASGYQIPTTAQVTQIGTNQSSIQTINTTISGYGDIVTHNVSEFATSAQGSLADTALQPEDNISELTNDIGFITKAGISATSPIAYNNSTGVISVASGYQIPTTTQVGKIDTALQSTDIIDNLTSTATNKALSANQGKQINDRLAAVESRGRFLSSWNCTTGKPGTDPETLPYAYRTGDYYIVDQVASAGGTNYRPSGSSYTGAASTTVETEEVPSNSTYTYDGTKWILQTGSAQTVTFSSIAGQPTDNTNLASALNAKVTANNAITGGTHTKITYDSKGLVTGGSDLVKSDIPALDYLPDDTTIDDLLPTQTGNADKVLGTNGTSASWVTVVRKLIATNPALTSSGGTCTWTISNSLNTADVEVTLKEASTNEEIFANVVTSASSITIRINSASNISAGAYKAIILG